MSSFTAIPSVDFADYLSGEESRKRKFVWELGEAYREVGFVAMTNHGIDQDLIDKFLSLVKEFSQLPLEAKKNYEAGGMRGYIAMGVEHAEGSKTGDLKEMSGRTKPVAQPQTLEEFAASCAATIACHVTTQARKRIGHKATFLPYDPVPNYALMVDAFSLFVLIGIQGQLKIFCFPML